MSDAIFTVPEPVNEPVLGYLPGSAERAALKAELARQSAEVVEVPLIIGGREIRTGHTLDAVMPHNHRHVIARVHQAGEAEVKHAIDAALKARAEWSALPWEQRAAVFLRAGELLAGPWRQRLNAATMLNQSKTCHQAEIDAACELIDFFRFNVAYMRRLYEQEQPLSPAFGGTGVPPVSGQGVWNRLDFRPLEGFVYAVTPFNFTSIAANLPHAPALMGCTVLWKPSPWSLYSNSLVMRLFEEAGLPPGVINFVPGDAEMVTRIVLAHREFAGLHYTGSTAVFRSLWGQVAARVAGTPEHGLPARANIDHSHGLEAHAPGNGLEAHAPYYRDYPRLVGETGGKDFLVAHASADPDALIAAMIRGAFEFQGQKCSALSRCYIPRSLWEGTGSMGGGTGVPPVRDRLIAEIASIKVGDPSDFTNFMGAVIHRNAFERCCRYINAAREGGRHQGIEASRHQESSPKPQAASPRPSEARLLTGGGCDDSTGYFIRPTLIETTNPAYASMCEEIFGPILTVYIYDDEQGSGIRGQGSGNGRDARSSPDPRPPTPDPYSLSAFEEALLLCDRTSPYALTGSVFATDRRAIETAQRLLRYAAGNFYINDKPTGAIVGQQPFGGARASGTNDKAGSLLNLIRWTTPRTIKETFNPARDYRMGFMGER